ncbi:hypothetical protein [Streptomyces sp. SD31]
MSDDALEEGSEGDGGDGDWKGYKKIVGVGDITGDGNPDLLAQDSSNTL